jgi:endoglucanase
MPLRPSTVVRRVTIAACVLLAAAVATLALGAPRATAGVANRGVPGAWRTNPLAGIHWGHYTGTIDGVWPAYQRATGRNKRLMGKIALRPSAYWFGAWFGDGDIRQAMQQYIAQDTGGDPNTMAQVAVFRLDSWEGAACSTALSGSQQASYRRWIDNFAAGVGSSRVALILQPDMPFALCAPTRAPFDLVAYAARRFTALPHTTVYIDAGAAWWPLKPSQGADMLIAAGLRHVRGFAMDDTQYDSVSSELEWGARIEGELAARGVRGKHMIINTVESGAPFLYGEYHGNHDNPRVCRNRIDQICASLGIPPTWNVTDPRWGLSAHDRSLAFRFVDAYLWVGRPWLDNGSAPFDFSRAVGIAAASPF